MKNKWLYFGVLACAVLSMVGLASAASFNVPAPASLSLTSSPAGKRVVYKGATNFKYQVQVSSNLTAWSLLSSNVATSQAISILDTASTNRPMRFYKANSLVTPLFYKGTFSGGGNSGSFVLLARTNNTIVFMANNSHPSRLRGEYSTSLAAGADDFACGTFIVGAPGCLQFTATNTIQCQYTNTSAGTVGTLTGVQKANVGAFSGYAGLYSGAVSAPHSGTARILLCPDGSFAFYRNDVSTSPFSDGGVDVLSEENPVLDVYLSGSVVKHVAGSYSQINRRFAVTIHEMDGSQSFATLNFTEPVF